MTLDIGSNRTATKYSRSHMIRRLIWAFALPLFRYSPRPFFAWRRLVLRLMGARVGTQVHIYASSNIYYPWLLEIGDFSAIGEDALIYNLGPVSIGRRATISHRAHLCAGTHDYTSPTLPLVRPPIVIADDVWVCADAFVGPGVTVGTGAVVGARAAVFKDVDAWAVVGGNPARTIKARVLTSNQPTMASPQ